MPTVLLIDGFAVSIRLPPREHGPPHVHVWKGGQHVVISLGDAHQGPALRDVPGMNKLDVARALRIVESHQEFLCSHGGGCMDKRTWSPLTDAEIFAQIPAARARARRSTTVRPVW